MLSLLDLAMLVIQALVLRGCLQGAQWLSKDASQILNSQLKPGAGE